MKDARLIVAVLIGLVIVLASIMVGLNLYPSWSQYARSLEEPLLFATLISISFTFLIRAYSFIDREFKLFNVFGMNVRCKHMNKATCILFALVLIFPVTHPYKWIETTHLICTGLAIGSAYLEVGFYSRSFFAHVGIGLGATFFIVAYFLGSYTVGLGELLASIPIAFFVLWNIKKVKNI